MFLIFTATLPWIVRAPLAVAGWAAALMLAAGVLAPMFR